MYAKADDADNAFVAPRCKCLSFYGMNGKKWSVSARIDDDLHRRFSMVSARFGVSDTQMITDALEALCDYVVAAGKYERPMKMVYDQEQAGFMGLVAEPAGALPAELAKAALLKKEAGRGAAKGAETGGAAGRS